MSDTLSLLSNNQLFETYSAGEGTRLHRSISHTDGPETSSTMRNRAPSLVDSWDAWWMSFLKGGVAQAAQRIRQPIGVIDLFASAGGLSLGVREAARALNMQFEAGLAADLDQAALESYKVNFAPAVTLNKSIRELVSFQILGQGPAAVMPDHPRLVDEVADFKNVDLVIGGPPCQGHSSLNNHTRGDDYRNDLYLTVPALAIALGARAVIIENVPRVIRDKQQVVSTSIEVLKAAGYFVTSGVISASDFGWPQKRSRHFLIASRHSQPMDIAEARASFNKIARPLWWAIEDLEHSVSEVDLMNSVPRMSEANRERVDWLFDHDAFELPNHVRPDCHKDGHTYPSVYGRLTADQPAPTITTGYQTPGRGRYIHPTQRRVLTPREAARIQGFPDSYQFTAGNQELTRGHLQKWIGDAVPSILGYIAGLIALTSIG